MMKKKIMIVDDEPSVIRSIKTGLDDLGAGYEIIGVNCGEECLDILKKGEIPDLILLDIIMPEMNGWVLYDILKANISWKNIPIVFLTALTDKISKGAGEIYGDDYIEKPFEIKDIKKRIDKILKESEG